MSDPVKHPAGAPSAVAGLLLGRPPMARALPDFDPGRAPAAPGPLFADWLAAALTAGVLDPQVATLSTIGADGVPDARMLVLRDVDADGGGWVFAIDADSPKGRQLAAHPVAALTLYWPLQGRQVRVRGSIEPASPEASAAEFATRSPGARAATLVGRQSEPLAALTDYDAAAAAVGRLLEEAPDTVAPTHTVYTLRALEVEFWQGDQTRRHVRLRYSRPRTGGTDGTDDSSVTGGTADAGDTGWAATLLWP
ncbi:pyridoxal 5'-phosphate synthase [Kitasatospora sp. NPDC057223]|uniref:pyridoxine/pyridoxamine 5'-phosphate oxidase n=1 Tax=Kitasatospora sp. NPDC057223 TaxID=3346055 RepID=UPI003630A1EF